MPQVPKRHHYIPEFYQKRWTSGKGTLVQYSKPRPGSDEVKALRVYPKATGYVDRLYEMRGLPDDEAQHHESDFFRPVDTRAATVLDKFEANNLDLDDKERSAWSNFLLSLVFRNPEHVEAFRKQMAADVANDARIIRRGRFKRMDGRRAEADFVRKELATEDGIARIAMTTLSRTIANPRLGTLLIRMQWGLIHAPVLAPALLTSDRPVLWEHPLDDERFRLMIPIGPKRVFFAAHHGSLAAGHLMSRSAGSVVEELNDHVTRRAVKFVYGMGDDALPFVQGRMGVDPKTTLIDRLIEARLELNRYRRRVRP